MKRLMIASDFDGTLCYEGKVSEADRAAVKRFREAGHLFGVVTGRLTKNALSAAATIEHDYTIACSGGVILDAQDQKICSDFVPGDGKLPALFRAAKRSGSVNFLVSTDRDCYHFDLQQEPDTVSVPEQERIDEVCFFCPNPEGVAHFIAEEADAFRDCYEIHINGGSVDMPALGVSKESGIRKFAALQGIDESCIYCVGDQTNDLPMIRAFHGFAVSNAVLVLKEAAEFQCDRIADMIDRVLSDQL